jgi:lysophospholipase L1-like esterase
MHRLRQVLHTIRDAWLILGIALLMLLVLEGMLSLAFVAWDGLQARSRTALYGDPLALDAYQDAAWFPDYLKESLESHKTQWVSYVYWRRRPYRGQYINIDEHGIRKTWAPDKRHAGMGDPIKVFMFGGSTMWGSGARDDFTIPSYLAKKLDERGIETEVVNFGEAGYVSTQEVITLIRQLHQGNVPDLVIFYDGVNDVYSACQKGAAGLPQNEINRVREFNLTQPAYHRSLGETYVRGAIRGLSTMRLLGQIGRRLGLDVPSNGIAARRADIGDSLVNDDTLFRDVLTIYRGNIAIVRALAQSYGFQTLFYWQPTIFDKESLTAGEQARRREVADLEPLMARMRGLARRADLAAASGGAFRDLSDAFSGMQGPVFIDWCHTCEAGNERIAERMVQDFLLLRPN